MLLDYVKQQGLEFEKEAEQKNISLQKIQNGKLVGAVTHVFVNDATKGFGIYIDWMLEQ